MNCDFCSKIWSSQSEYKKQFEHPYDETNAIVMESGSPYLYVSIGDWYYSDTYIQLNYCPKCGRKLQETQQCTK